MRLPKHPLLAPILFCGFATLIVGTLFVKGKREIPDIRLKDPRVWLENVLQPGRKVFVAPFFLPFAPEGFNSLRGDRSETDSALESPAKFQSLNRKKHFSAVLLDSYPASIPLAKSLSDSPLWILTDISPWGYLFKHAELNAEPPRSPKWDIPWATSPKNRTLWLLGTASSLASINRTVEAKRLIDLAEKTGAEPSLCLSGRASLAAGSGNWEEARTLAEQAVKKDRSNVTARMILTRALIECGDAVEALDQARLLSAEYPDDVAVLFLYARAANASNSNSEEINALLRIVHRNELQSQPLGASLAYLAQAYAKTGQRSKALTAFQRALKSPEMTEGQKRMLSEFMDHLMPEQESSSVLPSRKETLPEPAR